MKRIQEKVKISKTNYSIQTNQTIPSYNYVTEGEVKDKTDETPLKRDVSKGCVAAYTWQTNDTFPTFLAEATIVLIPKGVKRSLDRLPKRVLSFIDEDKTVAVEKCLMTASSLTLALFMDDSNGWKALNSEILHKQLKKNNDNTFIYSKVLKALQYSTSSTEPIIESKKNLDGKDSYQTGVVSKQFRFTKTFRENSLSSYEFKTMECIAQRKKYQYKLLAEASNNVIGANLLKVYPLINLPTEEEIIVRAKELIKENYHSKKGKLLTLLNHRKKSDFSKGVERSFVEDNIRQFKYLTKKWYMNPVIGDYKSGGRVVDSFNLMPSWIRNLCTLDNENMVELDFSALHPNIAISLFKGSIKFLTHEIVSQKLGINLMDIKLEHLSFFNKHPNQMRESILYEYYNSTEPEMLKRVIEDKCSNGYKNTSRLLFQKEVSIMTKCIKTLNKQGIYVLYVYDALYCKNSDATTVKDVMNNTILDCGVYTQVKDPRGDNPSEFKGILYKVENIQNGMVYIGSTTKSIEERKKDHIKKAMEGKGSSFQKAIATFGPETFRWESIDTADSFEELASKEKALIKMYDSVEFGYNKDRGGGFKKTVYKFDEIYGLIGVYPSLSVAAFTVFGRKKSVSNACLGQNKTYKGYYWSYNEDFILENSVDKRKKQVYQYELNGQFITKYESTAAASRKSGFSKSAISRVCRNERMQAGGYIWKYE